MNTPSIALASLSIQNFRGIKSLDLDFRGPDGKPNQLVVLAGPNGSGKTAVLEAALLSAGGIKLITRPDDHRAIRSGADHYLISAVREERGRETKVVHGMPTPKPFQMHEALPVWYFSSWRAPSIVGPVDATVGKPSRRAARPDQNRLFNVKQLLVNAATIERFENRPPQSARYSAIVRKINNAWREFYPDKGESFSVEVVDSDEQNGGSFDVYLRGPDGYRLEVDLLSSGQLELFVFLSALALNEDRQGIVFIDEPELHLDPQWHRLILRSLMKLQPRAQLIVATHSPEIYDEARSYERHFLVPSDDPRARLWPVVRPAGAGV
jgi:ABC-type transport system involved in cytochrome c biogenesis ATPase subunit